MVSTLIVGGGIGGLSLARELVMRGMPVTILEKAARIVPIGAGIIMNSNAMREFDSSHRSHRPTVQNHHSPAPIAEDFSVELTPWSP